MGSPNAGALFAGVVALVAAGVLGWALHPSTAGQPGTAIASPPSVAGPTRTVDGIPEGFAHSQPGAVAAAGSYVRTLAAAVPGGYVLRALAALTAPPLSDQVRSNARGLHAFGSLMSGRAGVRFMRYWPLGYRVDSFAPAVARVDVWFYGTAIAGATPTMLTDFSTDLLTLRWTGGDWKVSAHALGAPAPPPANGSTDQQALGAYATAAAGFREFSGAP